MRTGLAAVETKLAETKLKRHGVHKLRLKGVTPFRSTPALGRRPGSPHAAAFRRRRRRHETALLFDRADAVDPFTERFVDAFDDAEDYLDR